MTWQRHRRQCLWWKGEERGCYRHFGGLCIGTREGGGRDDGTWKNTCLFVFGFFLGINPRNFSFVFSNGTNFQQYFTFKQGSLSDLLTDAWKSMLYQNNETQSLKKERKLFYGCNSWSKSSYKHGAISNATKD
jgi:hypothetical protein